MLVVCSSLDFCLYKRDQLIWTEVGQSLSVDEKGRRALDPDGLNIGPILIEDTDDTWGFDLGRGGIYVQTGCRRDLDNPFCG